MNDEYDKTEKPPVEDWEMSQSEVLPAQNAVTDDFEITMVGTQKPPIPTAVTEDWTMNAPNVIDGGAKANDAWEMPPPVFQMSPGRKLTRENRQSPPFEQPTKEIKTSEPTPALPIDIQPQPFISEEFAASDVVIQPIEKSKSSGSRTALLIIGLITFVLLTTAFAVGIYFWFFYKPDV